jgi:hypothetical protein
MEAVPLEKFQQSAPPSFNADSRFTSKVSQLPGLTNPPPNAEPASKKAEPDSKKATPETKAEPDARSAAPTEKKAR